MLRLASGRLASPSCWLHFDGLSRFTSRSTLSRLPLTAGEGRLARILVMGRPAVALAPVRSLRQSAVLTEQLRRLAWTVRPRIAPRCSQPSHPPPPPPPAKLGLVARFKQLWSQYWYVVLPVHIVTSCAWFGSFYFIAASGLNVVGFLESLSLFPDAWLDKLRHAPRAEHVAVAYALYKLATPARYLVTIGGTHLSIRFLSSLGWFPTTRQVGQHVGRIIRNRPDHLRARHYGVRIRRYFARRRAARKLRRRH